MAGYVATGTHNDASLPAAAKAKVQELQKQYVAASTATEKAALHAQAEAIRAQNGYSGGDDGSEYNTFSDNESTYTGGNTATRTNTQPSLMGLAAGDLYGINYDFDSIKDLMNKATVDEYKLKRQQYDQTQNQFYNNLATTQATTLDTLRQAQASAVATGASKGIAAANELSSMLNLQQTSTDEALQLANDYNTLGAEEAAAYTRNNSTALETSNALKQAVASNIDLVKYGYDTQGDIGYLDYLAAMANVDTQKYAADKSLEATQYQTDNYNNGATRYANSSYSYNGGTPKTDSANSASIDTATAADPYKLNDNYSVYVGSDGTYSVVDKKTNKTYTGVSKSDLNKFQSNGAKDPGYLADSTYIGNTITQKQTDSATWNYDSKKKVWINSKTGEKLSDAQFEKKVVNKGK